MATRTTARRYDIKEWQCKTVPVRRSNRAIDREVGPTHVPVRWVTVTISDEEFVFTPEQYAESVEGWLEAARQIQGR